MGIDIGVLYVRRSAFMQASCERVWQEFSSFDRFAAWFGRGHQLEQFEPRLGASVRLSLEIDGARRCFGGEILVFDAARELTFADNWEVDGWPLPTFITLRLTPLFDGCQIELFHHGFERLEAAGDQLQGYEAGWNTRHLDALKAIVEG